MVCEDVQDSERMAGEGPEPASWRPLVRSKGSEVWKEAWGAGGLILRSLGWSFSWPVTSPALGSEEGSLGAAQLSGGPSRAPSSALLPGAPSGFGIQPGPGWARDGTRGRRTLPGWAQPRGPGGRGAAQSAGGRDRPPGTGRGRPTGGGAGGCRAGGASADWPGAAT